jgi:putative membrane protein
MRSSLLPAAALALLTFCSPANNRRNNETGMAQDGAGGLSAHDTMPSAAAESTAAGAGMPSPASILSQLDVANTTEIQLSTLAGRKASSPRVKQIAKKLAADHAKNREEARALAQKLNLNLTPAAGQASAGDSTALPPEIQGKSGPAFDKAFVEHEVQDHQANIDKIQNQLLPAAQNPELKAYLQKTLTAIQGHLAALKQVDQQLRS